jgi:hypothetical protein
MKILKTIKLIVYLSGYTVGKWIPLSIKSLFTHREDFYDLFHLCVVDLETLGEKTGYTYQEINIIIFCIIWPTITIALLLATVGGIFLW